MGNTALQRGRGSTRPASSRGSNQDNMWSEMGSLRYLRGGDFPKYNLESFANTNKSDHVVVPAKRFADLIISVATADGEKAVFKGTIDGK